MNKENPEYRLPKTIVPDFYNLCITPDIPNASFSGKVDIRVEVTESTQEILLNAADLVISEVCIEDANGTAINGTVQLDEVAERAHLKFADVIGTGQWQLKLTFAGTLNDKLRGFYRSRYKNADGQEEFMATTKFEPSDARRAFPCFDEPEFKARFRISLTIDENLQAVSNAHIRRTTHHPETGKKTLEFFTSIKMSTYLVAFIVGNLEKTEPILACGDTEICVWCVPGKKHLANYALGVAQFVLEYFEDYFAVQYPGEYGYAQYGTGRKLDLVAIPDFASGAMENFACITFRETALLVDEKKATQAELQRIADVVMHEIAHMWFGDYVTMSWWNGLWLNEAFATFMAIKAMDAWKPEWKVWEAFNIDRAGAMEVDGLHKTRSIEFEVKSPEQARAMFDVLTYDKGSAILRMLEMTLGEQNFRRGVCSYLNKHKFANADTPDLWRALAEANPQFATIGTSIAQIMDGWIFQPGYPLVSIRESAIDGCITIEQKPFKYLPTVSSDQSQNQLWEIPIVIRAKVDGREIEENLIFTEKQATIYLGENISSLVVNVGGIGFFRVQYQGAFQNKIVAELPNLAESELFNFVSDAWALVLSGDNKLVDFLMLMENLADNGAKIGLNVWRLIVRALKDLRQMISQSHDLEGAFLNYARQIILPTLSRLQWEGVKGEDPETSELRALLFSALGSCNDSFAWRNAQDLFALYKANKDLVDPNLIPAVIQTLAAHGDAKLYDDFVNRMKNATTPQEERRYLFALTSFPSEEEILRTLRSTINGEIRIQDAPLIMQALFYNRKAANRTWQYLESHWDEMVRLYPIQGVLRMCEGITVLTDNNLVPEVVKFFSEHEVKGGDRAIPQYIERMEIGRQFQARERGQFESMLLASYFETGHPWN